jgi:orotidine-5'-phosphate decarboxylase
MSDERLLVALDVETGDRALRLASALKGLAGGYKIGTRLFTLEGPTLVRELVSRGERVFLDLKFHDIPNTVAQAIESAVHTGAWMVNVHASGGVPMMEGAVKAGRETAQRLGQSRPLLIAVTVLTSMNSEVLREIGVQRPMLEQVVALAKMTQAAGMDGVVASAREATEIRRACGDTFLIVTPGIRGASAQTKPDDQTRTVGPADAIRAGATHIVVGRPIIAASDPRAAAEAIVAELELASPTRGGRGE